LGHRHQNIQKAVALLVTELKELQLSPLYETKAIQPPNSPADWALPYLNLVVMGRTSMNPEPLLERLKAIEIALGRDLKAPRWSPRIIDLDILAYDQQVIATKTLTIPHPELLNRPFLLKLMAIVKSYWRYPKGGSCYSQLTLGQILQELNSPQEEVINSFVLFPQLVGIVNVTPDSFSDGGRYLCPKNALRRVKELSAQDAAVIDIGAQSTRPGAMKISPKVEWGRLKPLFELLKKEFKERAAKPKISLDSSSPEVIEQALQLYPLDWINDVSGGRDDRILSIVAETGTKIILTHSIDLRSSRRSPMSTLCEWAEERIDLLANLGISRDKIILDPGIGFGKTALQSLSLLREIDRLKAYGLKLLVGHSRKSFLNLITSAPNSKRDWDTVGISHYLQRKGIDYLRIHNVEAHQRALTALALVEGSHDD
jgi:2-amino-4-hydroxy-6-hydroxymethyldihydropteridine diphosphokinase/dihydropteroate synthase